MSDRTDFYKGKSFNKRDIAVKAIMPSAFRHSNASFFTAEKACTIKNLDIMHNSIGFGDDLYCWWGLYILPVGGTLLPHMYDFQSNPTGLYYYDDQIAAKRIAYGRWTTNPNPDIAGGFPMKWKINDFEMKSKEQLILIINQFNPSTMPDHVLDFVNFHFDEVLD